MTDEERQQIRDAAKSISEQIIEKLLYHMRYKMQVWPKDDDISHISSQVKSIIVQKMYRTEDKNEKRINIQADIIEFLSNTYYHLYVDHEDCHDMARSDSYKIIEIMEKHQ